MADGKTPERIESASDSMGPVPASERIYHEIKKLITERFWPQGTHLNPRKIADMLAITKSITAVREALHRLHGEGLVARMGGRGFYVP